MGTAMYYCATLLAGRDNQPIWIESLRHCAVKEMIIDQPGDVKDLGYTIGNLVIVEKKPGAVASPTMDELNDLIKRSKAAPFPSAKDGYFYVGKASPWDTVEEARKAFNCPKPE